MKMMTPREFLDLQHQGQSRKLLDVRTPVEYREVHAQGAELQPLDTLDGSSLILSGAYLRDEPLAVICKSGGRGAVAGEKLQAVGFTNVVNIEGGTQAWENAGLPVVRGKKSFSFERQVRISAGSLVVIGVALGWFVSPWLFLLAGFVGGGLVFSGLTDTCGMGTLLAKMPWNQN